MHFSLGRIPENVAEVRSPEDAEVRSPEEKAGSKRRAYKGTVLAEIDTSSVYSHL